VHVGNPVGFFLCVPASRRRLVKREEGEHDGDIYGLLRKKEMSNRSVSLTPRTMLLLCNTAGPFPVLPALRWADQLSSVRSADHTLAGSEIRRPRHTRLALMSANTHAKLCRRCVTA
jgi:hypothetical protein